MQWSREHVLGAAALLRHCSRTECATVPRRLPSSPGLGTICAASVEEGELSYHLMIDLETWGTRPGCAIRSIGAISFEPLGTKQGGGFYANVSRESCEEAGLHVEPKTEAWWAEQSSEARARLESEQRPLKEVLEELQEKFARSGVEQIWSQGAGFDVPIWEAAAHALGLQVPWKFWNVRDTRTIYWAADLDIRSVPREGTHHDALEDARYQVKCVQVAMKRLRGRVL